MADMKTRLTDDDEAERGRCRAPFREALRFSFLFVAVWLLLRPFVARNFYLFLVGMGVTWGYIYFGWRMLWYGVALVAFAVPSAWRSAVQWGILLLIWSGPLIYFSTPSSSLSSIVARASGWTVIMAGIVGFVAYGLASAGTKATFRLPVRPLLVAVAVVSVLCYATKHEISLGSSEEERFAEDVEPLSTSPDERAYLHYLLYSTFAVGGVLVASGRAT